MTCSQTEAKEWIKRNWNDICERKELTFVLRRYYAVYSSGKNCEEVDDYVRLKKELEKLAIDKSD